MRTTSGVRRTPGRGSGSSLQNAWRVDRVGQVAGSSLSSEDRWGLHGNVTSGDTSKTRYLFTSREFDTATDLQYNRARWYDPEVGRWLSEDPLGFVAGDANTVRYVGNQITWGIDPSGQEWVWPWDPNASWDPRDTCNLWTGGWGIKVPGGNPYGDINVGGGIYGGGLTGGCQYDQNGNRHGYFGGGLSTPGLSGAGTIGVGGVTPGWQVGVQLVAFPVAVSFGWAFGPGGGPFVEGGLGIGEGASLSVYKVR